MNGIIVNDLENVIKRIRNISGNIDKDISSIKNSCSNLNSELNYGISFFKTKLNSDLQQFSKITKKVNGAEIVLSGVLRAYQLQDEAINYSLR